MRTVGSSSEKSSGAIGSSTTNRAPPAPTAPAFSAVGALVFPGAWSANGNGAGTLYETVVSTESPLTLTHTGNVAISARPESTAQAVYPGLSSNTTYYLFARAVGQVLHRAADTLTARGVACKVTVADALHAARHEETFSDEHEPLIIAVPM